MCNGTKPGESRGGRLNTVFKRARKRTHLEKKKGGLSGDTPKRNIQGPGGNPAGEPRGGR